MGYLPKQTEHRTFITPKYHRHVTTTKIKSFLLFWIAWQDSWDSKRLQNFVIAIRDPATDPQSGSFSWVPCTTTFDASLTDSRREPRVCRLIRVRRLSWFDAAWTALISCEGDWFALKKLKQILTWNRGEGIIHRLRHAKKGSKKFALCCSYARTLFIPKSLT